MAEEGKVYAAVSAVIEETREEFREKAESIGEEKL